jgi:hypothetical protein
LTDPGAAGDLESLRAAWQVWEAAGERSRQLLEKTERFQQRAEWRGQAYATLLEAQAMGYSFAIWPAVNGVPEPGWHATWHHNLFHLGQSIQDFQYGGLFLDGRRTYRMSGSIGEVKLLLLQVHTRLLGHSDSKEIANHDFHQAFDIAPDGSFEVILSPHARGRNWIRLADDSDANFLLMRRIVGDWNDDRGDLRVDLISDENFPPLASGDPMAAAIESAAQYVEYLTKVFTIGLYDLYISRAGGRKNAWAAMPGQEVATSLIGSRSTTYVPAVFSVARDEALLVTWEVPEAAYWSFQLGDVWSRPLDYIHHQTDINMQRAKIDADGKVRVVVSAADPGIANWLDPCGNDEGTIVTRSYRSILKTVEPEIKLVKFAELLDHLPADTAKVTPAERAQHLEYRRQSVLKFFGQ